MTQRDHTLRMLQEAGTEGVTNGAFIARRITRFSARIDELRKDGYEIKTSKETGGRWRYTLISEPPEFTFVHVWDVEQGWHDEQVEGAAGSPTTTTGPA